MITRKDLVIFRWLVCLLFLAAGCDYLPEPPVRATTPPGEAISTPEQVDEPVGPSSANTSASSNSPISSAPDLENNQVWFNSYPQGAKIYLTPATMDIYDLELENVLLPQNLLGTTPLTHNLSSGNYYVVSVFTPDLYTSAGYELPTYSDPTFDMAFPFDGNSTHVMSYKDGEEIERLSKIYRLNKTSKYSDSLISIALPLPDHQRGQPKPSLYPTLATVESLPVSYTFVETDVRQAIQDNLEEARLTSIVDPNLVIEMIEVLYRVGKVKLDTNDADLIIQMKSTDSPGFSITIFG